MVPRPHRDVEAVQIGRRTSCGARLRAEGRDAGPPCGARVPDARNALYAFHEALCHADSFSPRASSPTLESQSLRFRPDSLRYGRRPRLEFIRQLIRRKTFEPHLEIMSPPPRREAGRRACARALGIPMPKGPYIFPENARKSARAPSLEGHRGADLDASRDGHSAPCAPRRSFRPH